MRARGNTSGAITIQMFIVIVLSQEISANTKMRACIAGA